MSTSTSTIETGQVIAPEPTARRDWRAWAGAALDNEGRLVDGKLGELETALAELDPLHVRVVLDKLPAAVREAATASDGAAALETLRDQATKRIGDIGDDRSDTREPEPRAWLVKKWIPAGRAGIWSGPPGAGKTSLALMLSCAVASGESDWLPAGGANSGGAAVMRSMELGEAATAVLASWEDEPSEGERRRYWMGHKRGGNLSYARADKVGPRLRWLDMRAHGPLWGPRPGSSGHTSTSGDWTAAARAVLRYCERREARLLVLDPLAGVYGLNENDRALVRQFMAAADAWASENDCAVVLLAHPPKGTAKDGAAAYSGSTDWLGASRYLWQLAPCPSSADKEAPLGMRLSLAKTNHGRPDISCWLRWRGKGDAWEQCTAAESAAARARTAGGSESADEGNEEAASDDEQAIIDAII